MVAEESVNVVVIMKPHKLFFMLFVLAVMIVVNIVKWLAGDEEPLG